MEEKRNNPFGRRKTDMVDDRFVTYKWLIGTSLSTLGIVIAILGLFYGMMRDTINSKVNLEVYNNQYKSVCSDIDEIKSIVTRNAEQLGKFSTNQILVMRALKIEPVK
jgi:hypothetical protein